ncbi:MAG: two-component regulator propeller domain-containing protein, partial [Ignavibacteriaceae bacterium]
MQKSPFKILIVLFLFALCEVLTAQYRSFSFERFTIEDGLSNNSINCILQTSDGFLWIATKDGLNRFDGQSFVIFKHDPTSENSLPENYIMSLFESHDKTFWVGTWGSGLCKYDPIHESFIKIETNLVNDNYVQCIDEDKSGSLWFGTFTGGLFKYNPYSKQTLSFNINPGSSPKLINNNITTLVVNEDNSLWIGTWGSGFSFFDEQKNIVKHFTHNVDKNSLSNNNVWFLQKDEHGKILVCSDFGIDLYDPNTDSFTHNINIENKFQQILNTPIRQSYRDSYNRLWIGTYEYHGLLMIEKDRFGEAQIHHLVKETDNPLRV